MFRCKCVRWAWTRWSTVHRMLMLQSLIQSRPLSTISTFTVWFRVRARCVRLRSDTNLVWLRKQASNEAMKKFTFSQGGALPHQYAILGIICIFISLKILLPFFLHAPWPITNVTADKGLTIDNLLTNPFKNDKNIPLSGLHWYFCAGQQKECRILKTLKSLQKSQMD